MPTTTYRITKSMAVAALIGVAGMNAAIADSDPLQILEERIARLEQQKGSGTPLNASWQNGLRLESPDKMIRLQIGGRVQSDFAGIDADDELEEAVGDMKSGTKFRRGRVYFSGTLYEYTQFRVEYDFAGGSPNFRDAYMGIRGIPYLGTVRVGRMLELHSLEQLTGNNFHTFMERGLPAAFNEYWNNGVSIQNSVLDQRATWAVGAFKRANTFGDSGSNSQHNVSARVTALPVYQNDGRTWMHLGYSYVQRKPDGDVYSISSRPESSVAPAIVRTGAIPSDNVNLVGIEWAATHGPLSFQAEYQMASVDLLETEEFPHNGDADLGGFYVYASYFLTGEHRPYNKAGGILGRVSPKSNFRGEGHGWGAWEVAVRYSELDLADGPIEGGHLRDWTLGVNWYLNPNMRIMWNYVRADLKDVGEADILQMRAQFDF